MRRSPVSWQKPLLGGLFANFLIILTAQAWDSCGHEIIAGLAEKKLNAKARAAVEQAAREMSGPTGPYDGVTLACWMDDLKAYHRQMAYQGCFKAWHYINLGTRDSDPLPDFEPGSDNEIQGNVVQALKRVSVVLRGGTDPYIPSRAMACAMALHLVGDIHQPLHVASFYYYGKEGKLLHDNGGNRVALANPPSLEPKCNLHYFWDAAWRAGYDSVHQSIVIDPAFDDREGGHDARQVEKVIAAWQDDLGSLPDNSPIDFAEWAKEGNRLARTSVYRSLLYQEANLVWLSPRYVEQAHNLARQQMILAAKRLAVFLNETLGSEVSEPPPPAYPRGQKSPDYL